MNYTIQRLDKRFTYHDKFQYYIGFSNKMSIWNGPLNFTNVQEWFFKTYGWSAEVRNYTEIFDWAYKTAPMMRASGGVIRQQPKDLPHACNPHWSWTNGYEELRIYVASTKELTMFQLAFPKEIPK